MMPKNHLYITWADILGQHCSSYFEPLEQLKSRRDASPEGEEEQEDAETRQTKTAERATAAERGTVAEPGAETGSREDEAGGALGALDFEFSLLKEMENFDSLDEECEYRCHLIRTRFARFEEYLDRLPENRQCVMCHGPGADSVFLPIGDHDAGVEWDDPTCFCMVCRRCVTLHMIRCDLSGDIKRQRCRACWEHYGGYQQHNAATKKLMLMQAAKQVMLFCGPRREDEPEETFEENAVRRACIKTVI